MGFASSSSSAAACGLQTWILLKFPTTRSNKIRAIRSNSLVLWVCQLGKVVVFKPKATVRSVYF